MAFSEQDSKFGKLNKETTTRCFLHDEQILNANHLFERKGEIPSAQKLGVHLRVFLACASLILKKKRDWLL